MTADNEALQAVEKILSMGWTYHHEQGWVEPKPEQAMGEQVDRGALQRKLSSLVNEIERPLEFKPAKEEYFRAGVRAAMIRAIAEIEMFAARPNPEQAVGDGEGNTGLLGGDAFSSDDGDTWQESLDDVAITYGKREGQVFKVLVSPAQYEIECVAKLDEDDTLIAHAITPRPAVATPTEVTDEQALIDSASDHPLRKLGARLTELLDENQWAECERLLLAAQPSAVGVPTGKYADVLTPFVSLMERELHANAGKGDRPGWLSMDRKTVLLEIYYHLSKLQKAMKDDNPDGIREYAADVANMSMMAVDVCGLLIPNEDSNQ